MTVRTSSPEDRPVSDYVEQLPEPRRGRIAQLYAAARALAPDATEGVKYAMPGLVLSGKGFVSIMSTKKHIGIYPYSGSVVQAFAAELAQLGIPTTTGAIQLRDSVDLPPDLFTRILTARLAELGG
ncbi:MAG: DUF1801 domain-containing protein [Tetrasphaera sp.]